MNDATTKTSGWFKSTRGQDPEWLKRECPDAFLLADTIARRARWNSTAPNPHGLEVGDALIGDFYNYGLTEQRARTAKANLQKWGFATFKPTNKGTIARLTDTRLFSILPNDSNGQLNGQSTDNSTGNQRTEQRLTKNREEQRAKRAEEQKTLGDCPADAGPAAKDQSDSDWLDGLKSNPAYRGIDVEREHAKMTNWCAEYHKQPTRRRFINWLNRCEIPMSGNNQQPQPESKHESNPNRKSSIETRI